MMLLRAVDDKDAPPASRGVLRWEDPPISRAVLSDDLVAELRTRPGCWAVIRDPYRSKNLPKPRAGIEMRAVITNGINRLYARATS